MVKNQWRNNLKIFGVIGFYTITAITSTIGNKYFLKQINIPLTFLFFQMVVGSIILIACHVFNTKFLSQGNQTKKNDSNRIRLSEALRKLWPMILCNVFGLAFNIICLSKVDAVLHQVTRAISLPMTIFLGPILGTESSSWRVHLVCLSIVAGFLIAISGDLMASNFSLIGVVEGLISAFINAYNAQFIKSNCNSDHYGPFNLVLYNNIFSTVILLPITVVFEYRELQKVNNWTYVGNASLACGVLGILINYAGFLQIKVTSAITHCISMAARGVFQMAASVLLLRENLSINRVVGISFSLIASSLYPLIKNYDNRVKVNSSVDQKVEADLNSDDEYHSISSSSQSDELHGIKVSAIHPESQEIKIL